MAITQIFITKNKTKKDSVTSILIKKKKTRNEKKLLIKIKMTLIIRRVSSPGII